MTQTKRVLLVEHVDATGAAPEDARARATALRRAGCAVETIVLAGGDARDLQYPSCERDAGHGIETLAPDAEGLHALTRRVRESRPSLVLWASASPGGGGHAHVLPRERPALWWPTGHAPARTVAGPLRALAGFAPPCDGVAATPARAARRLSLWDGPFVLVASPPSDATAGAILDAFALAARERDEVELVLLDAPRPRLEQLARARGAGLRAHFVGPAPREAEAAWLSSAAAVLVPGDAPLSGGLLLRALELGGAPVPVGDAAAPIAAWLESAGCAWSRPRGADELARAIGQALDGEGVARLARERGRAAAAGFGGDALAARLAGAIGEAPRAAAA